ncbi:hypothetical protein WKI68_03380 [Streptomyces sp. MS1.HAVA.3]|uniref:Transcription regulator AsnC/Lrp ligand binding domain-containing protein n=1 Tax=Streptomyces caledonius TaxID=3134107 RepID=A0ABU8TYP2_9ACTN
MLHAYVLIEFDPGAPDVPERVRSHSLGMCKQTLVGSPTSGELIVHLEAEEGPHMNEAMVSLTSQVDGVGRLTVLRISGAP